MKIGSTPFNEKPSGTSLVMIAQFPRDESRFKVNVPRPPWITRSGFAVDFKRKSPSPRIVNVSAGVCTEEKAIGVQPECR